MKCVLENFKMAGYMAMELTGSQMGANILDNLSNIKSMAMGFIRKKMVIFIKESGKMKRETDMDGISMRINLNMMVYGMMIDLYEASSFKMNSF
jgi:hypothetical protein